jgi:hypothetical protein
MPSDIYLFHYSPQIQVSLIRKPYIPLFIDLLFLWEKYSILKQSFRSCQPNSNTPPISKKREKKKGKKYS